MNTNSSDFQVTSCFPLIIVWCNSIGEMWRCLNTLRPRQNGRHFAHDIFKCIFLNGNVWIRIKISMKFVPKGPINNIPALVQIVAWRRPGDKPLSEPMVVNLTTHICVTRPQWVNYDLRGTSISLQCDKGSNILATIYVCQRVQALQDFPPICRITTRTLDSVRWGSNNGIRFEFYIYF